MMFEKQGSGSRTEQKPNSHDARHAVMMLASWGRWSSTDAADADSPTKVCAANVLSPLGTASAIWLCCGSCLKAEARC